MAAELPRPGVEVIQVFRTVTPTVVTPTLVPCIVGVAKQIVEAVTQDNSGSTVLNGDALINLPAQLIAADAAGSPAVYTGLDGLSLVVSVNNAPNVTVLFADATGSGLTPASVVAAITAAFNAAGVTAARAEVVGNSFRVRTLGTGSNQEITVDATTSAGVLAAFAFGAGASVTGANFYNNLGLVVPQTNFPDPRANLGELAIENDSVRVFLATGNGTDLLELSRTRAFLRKGSVAIAASRVGTADLGTLTLPADLDGLTLVVTVDGGAAQTVTFAAPANAAAVLTQIEAQTTGLTATQDGSGYLVLTSALTGAASRVTIGAGTATAVLGHSAGTSSGTSIAVVDDGNGDTFSPILEFAGQNFTAAAAVPVVTGNADLSGLAYPGDLANKTLELSDGGQVQTITFAATIVDEAAVLVAINDVMAPAAGGKLTATLDGGNQLVLTGADNDSLVYVIGGTAVTDLGLTAGTIAEGTAPPVAAGDQLYIDGAAVGLINKVAPGGNVNQLRIDTQLTLTPALGTDFFIDALNLPAAGGRTTPELVVDLSGNVRMKYGYLRDVQGNMLSVTNGRAQVYLQYTAVRQDVSAVAADAGLLQIDSTSQLVDQLAPISTQNPLALGLFLALQNAPGAQVTGLGVHAVSADAPFGTIEAFTRAAEFLEAFEVYALAPLTHDPSVAQVFKTHVNFMSEPGQKGERIVIHNPLRPTQELDGLVASGVGNSTNAGGLTFDTGNPALGSLLLQAGVNPVGTIPVVSGVFLNIASDAKRYSVSAINGSVVTIRTTFAAGENDDGFYSTTALNVAPLPTVLINETFAVRTRGAALLLPDGTPDKQAMAETYQALGQSYQDRRFWLTAPDQAAATIEGVEQVINGFYASAAMAGMIGQQPPQQSFTNFPMAGLTRVIGSTKFFSERQMNIMAAGGVNILVQDVDSGPVLSRFALTTDLTSVETRTDSITKVVDFCAKFLRKGLKNFIGRFNITQAFLDTLGSVIAGLLGFLVETGVLIGANLNNLVQDEDSPDTVLVDVTLDVPFPANYIRLTLVV